MQHILRPRPPIGAIALASVAAIAGLLMLLSADRSSANLLIGLGLALVVASLIGLGAAWWWWDRAKLQVLTDDEALIATSVAGSARLEWSGVEAVTQINDQLRLRRHGQPAVILQLPSRVEPARVEALVADLRANLAVPART